MTRFDINYYITPTRFSVGAGVVLAQVLLVRAPRPPSPRLQRALRRMDRAAEELTAAVSARKFAPSHDARREASALGRAWVALREILHAKARLPELDEGARAAALQAVIFPQGTRFTRFAHEELWSASHVILERIRERGLEPEIAALAGPAVLPHVDARHRDFADVMGVGDAPLPVRPPRGAVKAAKAELVEAIADYGRLLVGELDFDDEESVRAFRRAVSPLDEHRARHRNGR